MMLLVRDVRRQIMKSVKCEINREVCSSAIVLARDGYEWYLYILQNFFPHSLFSTEEDWTGGYTFL